MSIAESTSLTTTKMMRQVRPTRAQTSATL